MKYRILGRTGIKVSRVCLGTMTFGQKNWGCDKQTSLKIIEGYFDNGGNFIDTADIYSYGFSEEIVGEAIQGKRDKIVLATKCYFPLTDDPNAGGLSRKHIIDACEASLRRLKTDYIDLYQIHGPDPYTSLEETMRALDSLVHQGKVRYIGCNNLYAWQIIKANSISELQGYSRFECAQYMYNLLIRDVEREILDACYTEGMGFICWSPLGSGMLAGKYSGEREPPSDSRIAFRSNLDLPRYWNERAFSIVEKILKITKDAGISPVKASLGWLLHDRRITSVIIGSRTLEQFEANMEAADWDIPNELREQMDNASYIDPGYPHIWYESVKNQIGQESHEIFVKNGDWFFGKINR